MLSPSSSMQLFSRMWQDFSASSVPPIDFRHPEALSSCFAVSDFAAASMGIAAAYLARLCSTAAMPIVDRRLASYWFSASARPHNRPTQQLWDPLAGDYQTEDGWIRLHTNAPTTGSPWRRFWGNMRRGKRWLNKFVNGARMRWNKRWWKMAVARRRCAARKNGDHIRRASPSAGNRC